MGQLLQGGHTPADMARARRHNARVLERTKEIQLARDSVTLEEVHRYRALLPKLNGCTETFAESLEWHRLWEKLQGAGATEEELEAADDRLYLRMGFRWSDHGSPEPGETESVAAMEQRVLELNRKKAKGGSWTAGEENELNALRIRLVKYDVESGGGDWNQFLKDNIHP